VAIFYMVYLVVWPSVIGDLCGACGMALVYGCAVSCGILLFARNSSRRSVR